MAITLVRTGRSAGESGQILVVTAIVMVALLGIAALALDVSYMFDKRNRLHAAADAAAKSAAIELFRNSGVTQASLEAFADDQVTSHGFSPSRLGGTTSVVINHPPTSGSFSGNANYVEAIVSEQTSTFFAKIIGWATLTPGATAVAGSANPTNCLITNQDLTIGGGNTQIVLNGCGAGVGGNLSVGNGSQTGISGTPSPPVSVTGSCSGQCGPGHAGTLATGTPPPTDPMAGLAAPSPIGTNCPAGAPGTAATLTPGCYTSIASSVSTLQAGTYYVTGGIDIGNNNTLTGTGVTIYMTGSGKINVSGQQATLRLTAPTSGTLKGIAIFQDVFDTNNWVAPNGFRLDITGVIYVPGADVSFNNNPNFVSTTCNLFIAKSLSLGNGTGNFSNSGCAGLYGGAAFLTVTIAQ